MRPALVATLLAFLRASADGQVVIDYVPVGNPGNPGDTTGHGSVPYAYSIGRTEVTYAQYAGFLNAVDPAGANKLGLYDDFMEARGGIRFIPTAAVGAKYSVIPARATLPATWFSFYDCVRFVNWLHNGQPTGGGGTETGAYTLLGGTAVPSNWATVARNPGATVFLPSVDEWYKAAYYDPAKPGGPGYWAYPMRTDAAPYSAVPPGTAAPDPSVAGNFFKDDRVANGYDEGYAVTGTPEPSLAANYHTPVGAYPLAVSGYGTLDQAGNLMEWTEAIAPGLYGPSRVTLGGNAGTDASFFVSSARFVPENAGEYAGIGFRVAAVPEPSGAATVMAGIAVVALRRRRAGSSSLRS